MNKKSCKKRLNDTQIEFIYSRNIDIPNRTLFFMPWHPNEEMIDEKKEWEVNDFTAQSLIKGLYILNNYDVAPITIKWLAYGGDWDAGIAIYDYIKEIKSPVTMQCYGRVRSMGTVILQACKIRLLSQHCLFLIHYGTAAYEATNQDFIRFAYKDIEFNNHRMENIYLQRIRGKKPKFSRKQLMHELEHDTYLIPKEAVDMGLADGVI